MPACACRFGFALGAAVICASVVIPAQRGGQMTAEQRGGFPQDIC